MPAKSRPRYGSMRFWHRKRSTKILPSVNWDVIKTEEKGLKGFIGYKVGMVSVLIKDDTPDSRTKGKKITIPATIIECPELKIFSVRAYNNGKVAGEVVVSNDKELRKVLKVPKDAKKIEDLKGDFEDLRIIVYSDLKKKLFKKTPDIVELGLEGTKEEKLEFIKGKIGKNIKVSEVVSGNLVDIRGVTKGFGLQGPVKRFGISLKSHKSEKGVRRPGSLGPWHPARVSFRVPQAGQTGFHTRIVYNSIILNKGSTLDKDISPSSGFHKYGNLKGDYLILVGSIQGPKKRQVLITKPLRAPKSKLKKKYEFIELR
jgi:large subunit ribosomal protein L3